MRIINTRHFPPAGYKCINLFGVLFVRGLDTRLSARNIRHESIHTEQGKEMLWIFFYLWYCIEYIMRLIQFRFNHSTAYRNISFEREAYTNEGDVLYLSTNRRPYAWLRRLRY